MRWFFNPVTYEWVNTSYALSPGQPETINLKNDPFFRELF